MTDATANHVRSLRVIIVSPGDVQRERDVSERVVAELNRSVAPDRDCHLSLWRWETDAWPRLHLEGPQGAIDEQMRIEEADLVIGLFWRRFGTPTHEEGSGTEHELRRAWAAWRENERPDVIVYFCQRAYRPASREETDQWGRVLDFRKELPREQLSWTYRTVPQFERLLREHLTKFLLERVAPRASSAPASEAAAGLRLRFRLPPVAPSFTGRDEELDALDEVLDVADRALVTQAIAGLGGVGKSQLAARYVETRADRYDIIAWIRAEEGGTADLAALAPRLGVEVEGLTPAARAQLALDRLGECELPWLLVLDNIGSAQQLAQLLPRGGAGRVLVTSRDRSLRQFGPLLELDVFDEDTATDYLLQGAGRPRDAADARRLATALGRLPLALSHAAAYCRDGTSFAAYAEMLDDLPAGELFTDRPDEFYERTVAATWKVSIEAAAARAPLAMDVLEMAAHLGPDEIPKELFGGLSHASSTPGRKRLSDALNALARFSLAAVKDDTVSVHRLLQKVVRDDVISRGERGPARRALAAVSAAFPAHEFLDLPASWPACEQLLPHALALSAVIPVDDDGARDLVSLLGKVSWYLRGAERGGRAVRTAAIAYEYAAHALGPEDRDRMHTSEYLALAYEAAGRNPDAIEIYEPLLSDRIRILGPEHLNTLKTRGNLANAYGVAGRTADAIQMYNSLLTDIERLYGPDHVDTLTSRHNLAIAYRLADRPTDAITIYEPLLPHRERILGADHPTTLRTRGNLAFAYQDVGRVADALAILKPLLTDLQRVLGPDHADTLVTHRRLADATTAAGRIAEV